PNFIAFVRMIRDAVHLQEVHTPTCVELCDGIVVGLSGRLAGVEAEIEGIPRTSVSGVGSVGSVKGSARDGEISIHGFLRDATQNVDSEFQTKRMHEIRQRLEAGIPGSGRKRVCRGS